MAQNKNKIAAAIAELSAISEPNVFFETIKLHLTQIEPADHAAYKKLAAQIETARGFINTEPKQLLKQAIESLAKKYDTLDSIDQKTAIAQIVAVAKESGLSFTLAEITKVVKSKANELAKSATLATAKTATASAVKFLKVSHKDYAEFAADSLLTRYLPETKNFITYDKKQNKWVETNDGKEFTDKLHFIINQQKAWAEALPACEFREQQLNALEATNSANFITGVRQYAQTLPNFSMRIADFDANKNLFNLRNGTIDLNTYSFNHADPLDLITQVANLNYDQNATCPIWEYTLNDILSGNAENIKFLQKYLGYSLLGTPTEKIALILYGERGNNGKSLITGTIKDIFGDYGTVMRNSVICTPKGTTEQAQSGHDTALMKIYKKRLVNFNEVSGNFIPFRFKQLIGDLGAGISAREISGRETTIYPEANLLLDTNGVPGIPANDEPTWRRITVLPFKKYYINPAVDSLETQKAELAKGNKFADKDLASKLELEYSGIFNWLLEGLKLYRKEGLKPTADMQLAKSKLRDERDQLQTWLNTNLKSCAKAQSISRKDLWEAWQKYQEENGLSDFKVPATFYTAIEQKGFDTYKYHGIYVVREKCLRTSAEVKAYLESAAITENQTELDLTTD